MKKVRIGVAGVGGMGQGHCAYMGKLKRAELTAVCDNHAPTAEQVGKKFGVPHFEGHVKMLESGLVDAVLIATPHYFHPPIAIDAFKRGIHVLSEKPIGVSVKQARRMVRAAERSGCVFSVMYQLRCSPAAQAAKKIIETGRLGELMRVNMVLSYYRSQAYYDSGGWRATWRGEGGGVLLNQAPHGLDQFAWLAGMPKTLTGRCRTRLHEIEVEEEAWATMEFPNGAHGYLYATVNEAPPSARFEIVGDRGKIVFDDQTMRFWQLDRPITKFTWETKEMWASPEAKLATPPLKASDPGHIGITQNFVNAILKGEKLIAPGAEGLWSVELANAIILSSYRAKEVKFPLKANEYEELLAELVAASKPKKRVREQRVTDWAYTKKKRKK